MSAFHVKTLRSCEPISDAQISVKRDYVALLLSRGTIAIWNIFEDIVKVGVCYFQNVKINVNMNWLL